MSGCTHIQFVNNDPIRPAGQHLDAVADGLRTGKPIYIPESDEDFEMIVNPAHVTVAIYETYQ